MTPSLYAIFLFGLSTLTAATNFTQVFEWQDEWDFNWPSEAKRTQALEDGTFKPEKIEARYMAVYGTRIFLSLNKYSNYLPVSLVSLPTISASSASPKLTTFPSWDMNEYGNCNKIEEASGLQVDSIGRLWVLDSGSDNCKAKLWTIDLINNDHTEFIHRFSFHYYMHDLVLDETPNGTFAYIARWYRKHIVVFSLERNQSWIVDTLGIRANFVSLSPKEEPRQLYLGHYQSNETYFISVATLRNETRYANPRLIGKWTAIPYRMLMDNHGTAYAAFLEKNYIHSWNTSQPFREQSFHEVAGLNSYWPFTFALDQNGTLWMTVFDEERKPKYRLLKAAAAFMASPELDAASGGETQKRILIDSSVFFAVLLAMAIP
ncbi:protein yellow-like [Cloeon dipterum]|uniref:protein yellow-like n=1 Tax=Cloeon dipterum TaxID=197152 RepID=UPI0032205078